LPIWLPLSVLSQKCNMVHFKWIWRFAYHGRFIGQFFWRSYCPFHLEYFNNSYILNRNFSKLHDCFLPNEDLKYCKGSFIWPFFKQFLAFLHLRNMKEYGGWHLFMSKVTFLNIFFILISALDIRYTRRCWWSRTTGSQLITSLS
jgi:hypothetical protein